MSAKTHLFACLSDNYGALLHDPASGATAAIDAPEAAAVDAALAATGWKLTDILVTHHHHDHTGGIAELKKRHRCRVVGPLREHDRIPLIDVDVREGESVNVGQVAGRVLETPGHTAGHISYWFERDKLAFVGDTLFSIGCGRLLEGTPDMMWTSLTKLRNLPGDTLVYCGHEYTKANVAFARTVEPGNAALVARAAEVDELRAKGLPTIPTTIAAENAANPFLRADVPAVAAGVGLGGEPPVKVFAAVRARKDKF